MAAYYFTARRWKRSRLSPTSVAWRRESLVVVRRSPTWATINSSRNHKWSAWCLLAALLTLMYVRYPVDDVTPYRYFETKSAVLKNNIFTRKWTRRCPIRKGKVANSNDDMNFLTSIGEIQRSDRSKSRFCKPHFAEQLNITIIVKKYPWLPFIWKKIKNINFAEISYQLMDVVKY